MTMNLSEQFKLWYLVESGPIHSPRALPLGLSAAGGQFSVASQGRSSLSNSSNSKIRVDGQTGSLILSMEE